MNFLHNAYMELVSQNIRGAVASIACFVEPLEAVLSWTRHGFRNTTVGSPVEVKNNPGLYDSFEIHTNFSRSVDWKDQEQATRGLRALSQFLRSARYERGDDRQKFWDLMEDVQVACEEDGFEFRENPITISQLKVVGLDSLNLESLTTTEGILKQVKKINRALVTHKDNAEVIGYSKSLMEATAGAVLCESGLSAEQVRNMKVAERCNRAMSQVGVMKDSGTGKITQGLNDIRKGLNKIVEGVSQMRREDTDEGHGMPEVRLIADGQARLASSAALLWCRYVLDAFQAKVGAAPF